jgi:hypothetical protein
MRRHKHHSPHMPLTAWAIVIALAILFIGPWVILVINNYSHWVARFAQ